VTAEPERGNPDEILRALLKQVFYCDKRVQEATMREYQVRVKEAELHYSEPRKLTSVECTELIAIRTKESPTIIVIDALDECDKYRRKDLLSALFTLHKSAKRLKVFISSRDEDNILPKLQGVPNIYINASDNEEDISCFVNEQVGMLIDNGELLYPKVSNEFKDWVINTLNIGARGM
jgi:hypothetical protein